mgnify:CR=1 FL=1
MQAQQHLLHGFRAHGVGNRGFPRPPVALDELLDLLLGASAFVNLQQEGPVVEQRAKRIDVGAVLARRGAEREQALLSRFQSARFSVSRSS